MTPRRLTIRRADPLQPMKRLRPARRDALDAAESQDLQSLEILCRTGSPWCTGLAGWCLGAFVIRHDSFSRDQKLLQDGEPLQSALQMWGEARSPSAAAASTHSPSSNHETTTLRTVPPGRPMRATETMWIPSSPSCGSGERPCPASGWKRTGGGGAQVDDRRLPDRLERDGAASAAGPWGVWTGRLGVTCRCPTIARVARSPRRRPSLVSRCRGPRATSRGRGAEGGGRSGGGAGTCGSGLRRRR